MSKLHDNSVGVYKGIELYDDAEIDSRDYGSLAMGLLAAEGSGKTLVISADYEIRTALTIPCSVRVVKGGSFTKLTGGSLAFTGTFEAGLWQVFIGFGAGDVTFGGNVNDAKVLQILPHWFGAVGDGVTDDSLAMDQWFAVLTGVASARGGVKGFLGPGIFLCDGLNTNNLNVYAVTIEGVSPEGSQIKLKNNSNTDLVAINKGGVSNFPTYWIFRNLTLDGNAPNQTTGSTLYLYKVDEISLENVLFKNGRDYNLYAEEVLGLKQTGSAIWTTNSANSLGNIYLKDWQYSTFNGALMNLYAGAAQWPITLEKTAGNTNYCGVVFNDSDLEGNKNGVKMILDGTGMGARVVFNNSTFWGLESSGGTLFDITADRLCTVEINGGAVLGSWDTNTAKLSAGAVNVSFNDVQNFSNGGSWYTQDYGGVKITYGDWDNRNFLRNGSFEHWDTTNTNVPLGLTFDVTGCTYTKDITDYHNGTSAFKMISTTTQNYLQRKLNADELKYFKGKHLGAGGWVKGGAAASAKLDIITVGGAAPTRSSDKNTGTTWEHLWAILYIPTDTTDVYIRWYAEIGKTATWDELFLGANALLAWRSANDSEYYGGITWNPGTITDGTGTTSPAITVAGAILGGDAVVVINPYGLQGVTATGYVSANNTVVIRLQNETGGNVTLASGAWSVMVVKSAAYNSNN